MHERAGPLTIENVVVATEIVGIKSPFCTQCAYGEIGFGAITLAILGIAAAWGRVPQHRSRGDHRKIKASGRRRSDKKNPPATAPESVAVVPFQPFREKSK